MVTDVQIETEATVQATTEDTIAVETTTEQYNVETTTEASYESQNSTENQLKIEGLVENVLSLGLDELKNMQDIIYSGTFYSLNSFGTTEYTDFKGVNLWQLLNEKALISPDAQKITVIAIDGYKMEFSIDQVKKQDYIDETNPNLQLPMIIAWEENGIEYNPNDGPPFKLIVGQKEEGDINKPQWIRDIDKIIVE
ncbi:MAG: molybdopterin-dependent oxidoreductase [Tissierellales bacterium]|nr:molybdopterin-dependent oxidoreductase [Tissierellales bacterium]MBN2827186.1 molybdopterin-dependent oxidoreductase [Tissierellales bacterium]